MNQSRARRFVLATGALFTCTVLLVTTFLVFKAASALDEVFALILFTLLAFMSFAYLGVGVNLVCNSPIFQPRKASLRTLMVTYVFLVISSYFIHISHLEPRLYWSSQALPGSRHVLGALCVFVTALASTYSISLDAVSEERGRIHPPC